MVLSIVIGIFLVVRVMIVGNEAWLGVDLSALELVGLVGAIRAAVALPPVRNALLVVAAEHPLVAFGT